MKGNHFLIATLGALRITRLFILLFMAICLGAIGPTTATADTFADNHHQGLADSSIHTFCFILFEGDQNVATYAMSVLDSTTDMSDSQIANCEMETDVYWQDIDLAGSLRGQYQCIFYNDTMCDSADVRLDWDELDKGSNDWEDRRKTAVHEIGHSVGTNHDSVSAMITGEIPNTDIEWRRYSTHDINHINDNY